jgi:hypothetical protein
MFQTQQTKDLRWLYLKNDESSESRIPSMMKSLINLMRFILSSSWWSSQEYHRSMKLLTCAMTTMKKIKNSKKPRLQRKVAQWLYKICSMCENMVSCVKMWLVLNICVKYAKCVKIWPFVWKLTFIRYLCQCLKIWSFMWKFYFQWIFMWNMFNVWKYGCFWSVCSFLKSCVQFLMKCVLSDKAKGRHAYRTRVSHLSKGRRAYRTHVSHLIKGRHALWRHVSLLLNMHKKALQIILHGNAPCASTTWSISCLKSSNYLD